MILVGIAHNSIALNSDMPCGATFDESTNQLSDWSKVNARMCSRPPQKHPDRNSTSFSRRTALTCAPESRQSFPTVNKYSDWIGWQAAHLTAKTSRKGPSFSNMMSETRCCATRRGGLIAFDCVDILSRLQRTSRDQGGRRSSGC